MAGGWYQEFLPPGFGGGDNTVSQGAFWLIGGSVPGGRMLLPLGPDWFG